MTITGKPRKKRTDSRNPSAERKTKTLRQILAKSRTFLTWLRSRSGEQMDAFLIMGNKLEEKDRKFLMKKADGTIGAGEDLLLRLAELEQENRYLKSISLNDDLTGLYNKRFFSIQLDVEMARTKRTGQPCCLIMIDFDNFKAINDFWGHMEGDRFLVLMSARIREKLRPTDFVCRYGGDEFAVIMPATGLSDAAGIARRVQEFVALIRWKGQLPVSASIGIAEYDPDSNVTSEEFFKQADIELYRAKRGGKNRISHFEMPDVSVTRAEAVRWDEKEALLKIPRGD
jgi:diguanylate cyclase (GGDEF)-like protein